MSKIIENFEIVIEQKVASVVPGNTTWALNASTMIKIVQHYMNTVVLKDGVSLIVHSVVADNISGPSFRIELKG